MITLSVSRALGAIIGKFRNNKNMSFETCTHLFEEYDMNKKNQITNFQTFKTDKLLNDIDKCDFAEI